MMDFSDLFHVERLFDCIVDVNPRSVTRLVCKSWRDHTNRRVKSLRIHRLFNVVQFANLQYLLVNELTNAGEDLLYLSTLTNLRGLSVLVFKDFEYMRAMTNLTSLNLAGSTLNCVDVLESLKNLVYLDVSFSYVKRLPILPKLAHLEANYCDYIIECSTGNALKRLGMAAGIPRFQAPNQLTSLDISGSKIEDIKTLRHCGSLRRLNISGCVNSIHVDLSCFPLSSLRMDCVQYFPNFTFAKLRLSLTRLSLANTNVTNQDIHIISKRFVNLQKLNVSFCGELGDDGFRLINHLKALNNLNMSNINITDNALHFLGGLRLQRFLIRNTSVTMEALCSLTKRNNIQYLGVTGCNLTGGFDKLGVRNIEMLY